MSLRVNLVASLLAICVSQACFAEGMEGTGLLSVPPQTEGFSLPESVVTSLALNDQGRLVLNARKGDVYISGNAEANEAYTQFELDYFNAETGLLQAAWGSVEVLLSCGQAEILISQNSSGKDPLFAFGKINFPYCAK